jgi:hypothetical protein
MTYIVGVALLALAGGAALWFRAKQTPAAAAYAKQRGKIPKLSSPDVSPEPVRSVKRGNRDFGLRNQRHSPTLGLVTATTIRAISRKS